MEDRKRIYDALYALCHLLDDTNSVLYEHAYSDGSMSLTDDIDAFKRTLSRWMQLDTLQNGSSTDGSDDT